MLYLFKFQKLKKLATFKIDPFFYFFHIFQHVFNRKRIRGGY